MAERLRQILDRIVETWKNWTKKQKTIIISSVAVIIVAVAIVVYVLNRPDYQVLTTCKDYTEINSVTSALDEAGYSDYVIDDKTMVVRVPKSNLTNAKMAIASADIKSDGYTFEDAMNSSFTTTESDKTKQYQHYLESKFKNDLETMDGIKSATVNVSLADETNSFYANSAEASVGVTLHTTKEISDEMAESIANLLATSVGNKTTENITIVDNTGKTLFSGMSNASSNSGYSYPSRQKYKGMIEATVKNSMRQNLLSTGLYDDVQMTLNYVLDWDTVNTIAKEYSTQGDKQSIFDSAYIEKSEGMTGASGTPGTTSNDDDTTYEITDGYGNTSTYSVENYDYLPNELVTTTEKEPGSIIYDSSTLSVTFIDNIIYNEEECKELGYLDNMSWDEFKSQNSQPVLLEVDENWIDSISKGTGIDAENISVMAYQRPYFEDAPGGALLKNATFWLQIVLAIVILGLLAFVVIRSARPLTVEEKEPELSVEEMLASTREKQAAVDDIDIQEKSETRKAIEKFVDENPEAVALLLRNWLNEGWN